MSKAEAIERARDLLVGALSWYEKENTLPGEGDELDARISRLWDDLKRFDVAAYVKRCAAANAKCPWPEEHQRFFERVEGLMRQSTRSSSPSTTSNINSGSTTFSRRCHVRVRPRI